MTNRGVALHELARAYEAPADHNALSKLRRLEQALASHDAALAARPDHVEALTNRGVTLYDLKRFDEALAGYDRAIALRPDHADAHLFKGLASLVTGDFARGWIEYQWRRKAPAAKIPARDFAQPLWLGEENIAGKTILLHSEQGFGDSIQFCRYVPLVAARGARVILEVEEPLRALMAGLAGVAQMVAQGRAVAGLRPAMPASQPAAGVRTGSRRFPRARRICARRKMRGTLARLLAARRARGSGWPGPAMRNTSGTRSGRCGCAISAASGHRRNAL